MNLVLKFASEIVSGDRIACYDDSSYTVELLTVGSVRIDEESVNYSAISAFTGRNIPPQAPIRWYFVDVMHKRLQGHELLMVAL